MKYFAPTRLSERIHETPEGYLVCMDVPIGRTGSMIYGKGELPIEPNEAGQIQVSRTSDELFHTDTLASFEGKPVTLGHPDQFVGPVNWSELAKGVIQNVRKALEKDADGEEMLMCDLLITDAMVIGLVKNGLREVSCGYEAIYEQLGPGLAKQKEIRGNHLGVVDRGRAGPTYAIVDHKAPDAQPIKTEKSKMAKWADKMKQILGKAVDEAAKEDMMKDEDMPAEKLESMSQEELVAMVKKLMAELDKAKEAKPAAPSSDEDKKDEAKDADLPVVAEGSGVEDRLKALELAVTAITEKMAEWDEAYSESDLVGDAEEVKKEEEKKKTGDKKLTGLEQTKNAKAFGTADSKPAFHTAEALNEMNKAFWSQRK